MSYGSCGDVLELTDELAIDLERHGRAEFIGEEAQQKRLIREEKSEGEEKSEAQPHKEKTQAAAKGKKK